MMTKVILFGWVLYGAGTLLLWIVAMSEANEAALIGSITPTIVAIGAIVASVLSYRAAKDARQEAREAKTEARGANEQVALNTTVTSEMSALVNGQHTEMVNALKASTEKVGELEKEKTAAATLKTFEAAVKEVLAERVVAPDPAPPQSEPRRPGVPPFPPHRGD